MQAHRRDGSHMPGGAVRAVVYCRVSTDDQQDNGTSLDSQLDACLKRANEKGYSVDPDLILSGWESAAGWRERKILQRALDAIRNGDADVFLCYAVDRLSRRQAHTAIISEIIQVEHQATLEFVTEEFEDSIVGEFVRNAKAFAAEIELEKIRERTVRGKLTRLKSGKLHSHGSELYGYRRDKERGVRHIHDEEADVVRQIFEWMIGGVPVRTMVRRLNAGNCPSPAMGKLRFADGRVPKWDTGTIYRILAEPAYKGQTHAWRWQSQGRTKNPQLRDREEWIELPDGTTPAIVEPDMWQAVQDIREQNRGVGTRNGVRQYLLRGLIFCGTCGGPMRSSPERNIRVYRCSSRERGSPCGGKRVPANPVEAWVWEEVARILEEPERITKERERLMNSDVAERMRSDKASTLRRIHKIEAEQSNLVRQLRQAGNHDRLFELAEAEIASSETERQHHLETLAAIESQLEYLGSFESQLQKIHDYCATIVERLDSFDFDEKRKTLEALAIEVTGDGREWSLEGAIPTDLSAGKVSRSSS